MKKYYPIDFDTKGNAILGDAKNTPTSNSFIPTTWAPSSSGEKHGILSIEIVPPFETTPALDTFFPLYFEDLTEEQIMDGVTIRVDANFDISEDWGVKVTPTETLFAWKYNAGEPAGDGGDGQPVTYTMWGNEDGTGIKADFSVEESNPSGEYPIGFFGTLNIMYYE